MHGQRGLLFASTSLGTSGTSGTIVCYMFTGLYTPLQNGASPLYIASQEGHSEVVNVLVKNGADINQPMNVGRGLTLVHSFCMFITYSSHTDWWNIPAHI